LGCIAPALEMTYKKLEEIMENKEQSGSFFLKKEIPYVIRFSFSANSLYYPVLLAYFEQNSMKNNSIPYARIALMLGKH
jgi:hypothetical protein